MKLQQILAEMATNHDEDDQISYDLSIHAFVDHLKDLGFKVKHQGTADDHDGRFHNWYVFRWQVRQKMLVVTFKGTVKYDDVISYRKADKPISVEIADPIKNSETVDNRKKSKELYYKTSQLGLIIKRIKEAMKSFKPTSEYEHDQSHKRFKDKKRMLRYVLDKGLDTDETVKKGTRYYGAGVEATYKNIKLSVSSNKTVRLWDIAREIGEVDVDTAKSFIDYLISSGLNKK